MPTITLANQSVDFGVCTPGFQTPILVSYQVSPAAPFNCTIEMATLSGSGLVATLTRSQPPAAGKPQPYFDGATTSGASGTTNTEAWAPPGPHNFDSIRIDFWPPDTPMPMLWSGVVSIFWNDPSATQPVLLATLMVSGKTAQLDVTVTGSQPITLTPGQSIGVPLQLEYDSLDAAPINLSLGPSEISVYPEPAGLTIQSKPFAMPPSYISAPEPKGSSSTGAVGAHGGVTPTLNPHRILPGSLTATASKTITPGNNQAAYIQFGDASLPQQVGSPRICKVVFNIPPLPISMSVLDNQPVDVVRGRSVNVRIGISYDGKATALVFEQPSGHPDITLTAPACSIGQGETDTTLPISITADDTKTTTESITIDIPWSANNGLSKSTLAIELRILPGIKTFASGDMSTPSYGLSGSAKWTFHQDGRYSFSGSVNNTSYSFLAISSVKDQKNAFLAVNASNTTPFDVTGSNERIQENWDAILIGSVKFTLTAYSDIGDIIGSIAANVGIFLLTVGAYFYGGGGNTSVYPPGQAPQSGDDGT